MRNTNSTCKECESEIVFHADLSLICNCDCLEPEQNLKDRPDLAKKWDIEQEEIAQMREDEKEYASKE